MLSGATGWTAHSDAVFLPQAGTAADIQGYSPAQVRQAYGFPAPSAGAPADGAGQTIAIVDAYNDPNIRADLNVFDSQYNLPAADLKIVSQSGGSSLPSTDAGWAGEISLDVEWAHAIAPAATILLVESNSATLNDLLAGVQYARHAAGVSVVSMSWGGSEFFSYNGQEFTGQTQYDPIFTTPSGHQGVTFVAAAGDSGSQSGVQWPASSPNVLSVGGTSLYVSDQSGTYYTESSWSGTSGGFSQIETTPAYQQSVNASGVRTTPDVAYDGDPNTGFAVYDSIPDQGYSGWQVVGGTSAGAPQWAALVALADQQRAIAGKTSLDGASQTLPLLYSLYDPNSSAGGTQYANTFNDVVDSGSGSYRFRWGIYGYGNPATPGYDTATGLGTPKASAVVAALAGSPADSTGPGSGGLVTALPASPITGTIVSSLPSSVLAGASGTLRLKVTNTGADKFTGPLTVSLYATTDGTIAAGDTPFDTVTVSRVSLKSGGSKILKLKFDYPSNVSDGDYQVVASIDASGTNTAPAQVVSPAVKVSAPFVDLAASSDGSPVVVQPGKNGSLTLLIQNQGNVTATGTVTITVYASQSGTLDGSESALNAAITRRINLRPGHSLTLHVRFAAPAGQTPGSYYLVASMTSLTQPADTNSSNDLAVIPT